VTEVGVVAVVAVSVSDGLALHGGRGRCTGIRAALTGGFLVVHKW